MEIHAEKGAILFSPGDATRGFYAVLDGTIRVYRVSPKGKEITLEIVGAGSTFAGAGHGYCSDLPVERYLRDARGLTFHFGTTEMLKDSIAGILLENV